MGTSFRMLSRSADLASASLLGVLAEMRSMADNMLLNHAKEQVLWPTTEVKTAWEARGGSVVAVAKGLGVKHCGCGDTRPEFDGKIAAFQCAARRIRFTVIT